MPAHRLVNVVKGITYTDHGQNVQVQLSTYQGDPLTTPRAQYSPLQTLLRSVIYITIAAIFFPRLGVQVGMLMLDALSDGNGFEFSLFLIGHFIMGGLDFFGWVRHWGRMGLQTGSGRFL